MTEATEKTDAKQVSKAKALATQRARDIELLATVEGEPGLFKPEAATGLKTRIADATRKIDAFSPEVRAQALTPGQLNDLVSGAVEKAFVAWYPEAFAQACESANVSEQAIASKGTGAHNITVMGLYDHKSKSLVKRPKLQKIVTLGRKGLS